jgi:hypothetical protein
VVERRDAGAPAPVRRLRPLSRSLSPVQMQVHRVPSIRADDRGAAGD